MNTPHDFGFDSKHERDVAEDAGVYKTLLESTHAIPWKLDWPALNFAYIGPQIEPLLGWAPDSWRTVEDWATRIHPDDRERVVGFCVAQSQAGVDHEADYRALTKDGGYVWIRDVVHVKRNDAGEVTSLVGFMFDISERKQQEQELLDLQKQLEALSLTDALTGIANRRQFDQRLELEWNESARSGKPLSLLILDVDWFKPFNDTYGHPAGDDVLRQVALVLDKAAQRPRDIAARLGGDEFVLLLPDTDATDAQRLARLLSDAVAGLRIPHGVGGAGGHVSASVGCATQVGSGALHVADFVAQSDRGLYAAKRSGRGQVGAGVASPA